MLTRGRVHTLRRLISDRSQAIGARAASVRSLAFDNAYQTRLRSVVRFPIISTPSRKMTTDTPALKVLRRKDYTPVPFTTKTVDLKFVISNGSTRVEATLGVARTAAAVADSQLVLNHGNHAQQNLVSIEVNGAPATYTKDDKTVSIAPPAGAESFMVRIVADVVPEKNTALEGLYRSGSAYCTQCEAEGFRHIIPFQDRPDVMAVHTVRIEADKASCPVLLSNGNLVSSGDLDGQPGRHYSVWHDPFPKPCYLFALVAGDLAVSEDSFKTVSGKDVALRIFTSARDADKTSWAMASLKRAMAWDEEKFGREYDLSLFNIVAVPDFNMGAMENKSLNIFNSRLILASTTTASDVDYNRIEGVVAHEYFHNWTGNRVTCRDWFQLTLKEGLTVYRDQEFTADCNSRAVKRIEDVARLRVSQFGEDSGPTAHPIRPEEVGKQDNFYTATVYEKGAEIIRLYQTVLGRDGFRRGMDLYFQRHDGQAVTCDDFWQAMYDANEAVGHPGVPDLHALKTWYGQAGTPELTVIPTYDAAARTLTLACTQRTPATPGQPDKKPVLIPIAVGLVGPDGKDLPLTLDGAPVTTGTTAVLRLTQASQSFTFNNVPVGAVPSILRGFSAPVRMTVVGQSDADLAFLFAHDADEFNRWEAGQRLGRTALLSLYVKALGAVKAAGPSADVKATVKAALDAAGGCPSSLSSAFASVLADTSLDGAYLARAISLPSESEIVDTLAADAAHGTADPLVVHEVRTYVVTALACSLRGQLEAAVSKADEAIADAEAKSGGYSPEFTAVARRAIRNKALAYLSCLGEEGVNQDLFKRYSSASNMTDGINCLAALVDQDPASCPQRQQALEHFYNKFKDEPLVLLKWLALQAGATGAGNTAVVKGLMSHLAFAITNPNACYSLFGAYTSGSTLAFHAADGSGYTFLTSVVQQLDAVNPQVAARIVGAFAKYRSYDATRQGLMRKELETLAAGKLSENVAEIVSRSLAA